MHADGNDYFAWSDFFHHWPIILRSVLFGGIKLVADGRPLAAGSIGRRRRCSFHFAPKPIGLLLVAYKLPALFAGKTFVA